MEDLKYFYIADANECNICYENHDEFFKCKRCTFLSCPRCFNNFYFLDEVTYCPMCRF